MRFARYETGLISPVKYFYRPFQGSASFVDHSLCLVVVVLSRLFIDALWPPEGKGLASWLLFVMFIVMLLLSHLVGPVWYLIESFPAVFLTLKVKNLLIPTNACKNQLRFYNRGK